MRRRPDAPRPLAMLLGPVASVALIALSVTGCLRDPDPFPLTDGELTLHFVLEAGAESVVGLVTRSVERVTDREIPDAAVRISTGADTVTLTYEPYERCAELRPEWPMPHGCYQAALPAPVAPGRTYDLEVVLPDGVRATGETTVPEPLTLTSPGAGERLVVECGDPVRCGRPLYTQTTVAEWTIRWSPGGGAREAAGVSIALVPTVVFLDDQVHAGDTCRPSSLFRPYTATGDSAVWRVLRFDCLQPLDPARFDSIHADLVAYALNDEYLRYLEAMQDETIRVDAASAGVDGAWGLFGAVTSARREVVLLRDPPPGPPPNTR